ncbi:hypothetical protein SCRM01_243 [Synechococcus phage S-CRM01]|uniref:hypothetical protein n=1 Tax=Synechococcus phage S-CRM01 TaxID=1026955 RepID=UPI000209E444|nr:hypothetical protein SCRM01_243 [Synechococcus phage S-CRM01]AEC53189.1 hypothetical protein SCRM01_243 [Synechococcus phage S-CRM01]
MLSNKSIQNITEQLWPEYNYRVDYGRVLGRPGILAPDALNYLGEIALNLVEDQIGVMDISISQELAQGISNELASRAVREVHNFDKLFRRD